MIKFSSLVTDINIFFIPCFEESTCFEIINRQNSVGAVERWARERGMTESRGNSKEKRARGESVRQGEK